MLSVESERGRCCVRACVRACVRGTHRTVGVGLFAVVGGEVHAAVGPHMRMAHPHARPPRRRARSQPGPRRDQFPRRQRRPSVAVRKGMEEENGLPGQHSAQHHWSNGRSAAHGVRRVSPQEGPRDVRGRGRDGRGGGQRGGCGRGVTHRGQASAAGHRGASAGRARAGPGEQVMPPPAPQPPASLRLATRRLCLSFVGDFFLWWHSAARGLGAGICRGREESGRERRGGGGG